MIFSSFVIYLTFVRTVFVPVEGHCDDSFQHNPYKVTGSSPTEVDRFSGQHERRDNDLQEHLRNDTNASYKSDTASADPVRDQITTATGTVGDGAGTQSVTTNATTNKSKVTMTETGTPGSKTMTITEHVQK